LNLFVGWVMFLFWSCYFIICLFKFNPIIPERGGNGGGGDKKLSTTDDDSELSNHGGELKTYEYDHESQPIKQHHHHHHTHIQDEEGRNSRSSSPLGRSRTNTQELVRRKFRTSSIDSSPSSNNGSHFTNSSPLSSKSTPSNNNYSPISSHFSSSINNNSPSQMVVVGETERSNKDEYSKLGTSTPEDDDEDQDQDDRFDKEESSSNNNKSGMFVLWDELKSLLKYIERYFQILNIRLYLIFVGF